ncbi:MAG: spore coat protein [Clostridia bacterium]|jgi:spore coat protein JB|nr:spore coat protein [Clostridiales bacterium]MDN5324284.1 spore coat protein [Clostridia bacterium]
MEMNYDQVELLKELMRAHFCAVETALYLDTHPKDPRALADHNKCACRLEMLRKQYIQKYGALTHEDPSVYPWTYINGPWPWEIKY